MRLPIIGDVQKFLGVMVTVLVILVIDKWLGISDKIVAVVKPKR